MIAAAPFRLDYSGCCGAGFPGENEAESVGSGFACRVGIVGVCDAANLNLDQEPEVPGFFLPRRRWLPETRPPE